MNSKGNCEGFFSGRQTRRHTRITPSRSQTQITNQSNHTADDSCRPWPVQCKRREWCASSELRWPMETIVVPGRRERTRPYNCDSASAGRTGERRSHREKGPSGREAVASSRNNHRGLFSSTRAKATRCVSPPDSVIDQFSSTASASDTLSESPATSCTTHRSRQATTPNNTP